MTVNGSEILLKNKITIKEFLISNGYHAERVVVERNGEIITKKNFDSEFFYDTDKVEIINFVGGG